MLAPAPLKPAKILGISTPWGDRIFLLWTVLHVLHPVGFAPAIPLLFGRLWTRRAAVLAKPIGFAGTFALAPGLAEITALLPR